MVLAIKVDVGGIEQKFDTMRERFENFPPKMEEVINEWQSDALHRDTTETERPDSKTVQVRKRARGKHRFNPGERAVQIFTRRILRRLTPKPIRQLRRFARIGRKPQTLLRKLTPPPARRLMRMKRQVQRVAAGRPAAVMRALGPVGRVSRRIRTTRRRARLNANLWQELIRRMTGAAGDNLTWH